MAETITTDLFKFVAIRPAQRVTEKETRRTIIRDERKANPDGAQMLALLARRLAPPGAALAHWREFDLSALEPLADGYRALVHRYEQMDADEDPPDGWEILREILKDEILKNVRVTSAREERYQQLLSLAWDALYTADRTGPDAGPRIETPMAALRLLHFAQLLGEETHPTRAAALEALHATPAIPTAFYDALPIPATPLQGGGRDAGSSDTQADSSARSTHLRRLAQELDATERLLELVTNAPSLGISPIRAATNESTGGWTRNQFSLSTVPTLRSALTGQLTRDQALLLDRLRVAEETPVDDAAKMVHSHLRKLSGQAFSLGSDQEFQGYMRELKGLAFGLGVEHASKTDSWSSLFALDDPGSAPDVDVSGRITPLGIGDLKVVKQTLLAYVPGEVAHIENVLTGELKERKHRKLDRTETTLFTSEEETKETERDTQSTDRFELKREAEQTIKEDMSVKAGLNVTASFGPVVTTATGDFAYSTSKQDSQKSSSNFAREVVDRSVSKLQTKTKTERTTKTLSEVEEINTHGLNNTSPGTEHVIGIYRWVDKRYRAQIYNYGVRLLLEFIVPEPAAFYRAAQIRSALKEVNATPPPDFINILTGNPLTVEDITETSYQTYASRYNAAGVTPPPEHTLYVGTSIVQDNVEKGKAIGVSSDKLKVPDGYTLNYYSATTSIVWVSYGRFCVQIGRDQYGFPLGPVDGGAAITTKTSGAPESVTDPAGIVPVSVAAYDVIGFAVNVQGVCQVNPQTVVKWQLQTFDKIYAAYQALKTAYDQKVTQAEAAVGITIEGRNPAMNRTIEKMELKKLCITMMTGQHFKQFNAMTDPADKPNHHPEVIVDEALSEGRIVQFFEQAFEWEQMTYLYYPYFWGRKRNWIDVMHRTDPDPLFAQFLTAGYARVVVPVPLAYKKAVEYMLKEKGTDLGKKVWLGGDRPTFENDNDDLYVSITEELRNQTDDLAGAIPEGTPWEFTLPTTLVWLQPDSILPSFI